MTRRMLYLFVKRVADIVLSLALLVILSPLLLIVAVAIRLETPGPIIYRQRRIGKGGKPFTAFRFRTMFIDAEERLKLVQNLGENEGPVFKLAEDPRITRVGRVIRQFNIDELPDLFNVISGSLSLVGPRPMFPREAEVVFQGEPQLRERFQLTPGITGLSVVMAYRQGSFALGQWLKYDVYYVRNVSLWLDLKIVIKTLAVMLLPPEPPLEREQRAIVQSIVQDLPQSFERAIQPLVRQIEQLCDVYQLSEPISRGKMVLLSFDGSEMFSEIGVLHRLPMLFPRTLVLQEDDLRDIHTLLMGAQSEGRSIGLCVFFGSETDKRHAVQATERLLRGAYACDLVYLDIAELRSLMATFSPQQALRSFILSRVDLMSVSPFVVNGPTSQGMFFGREQELREIVERAAHTSYAVIGGRRIGKSSLLMQLHQVRLGAAGYLSVYCDCSRVESYHEFLGLALQSWQPAPPPGAPSSLAELLQWPGDRERLVLLLDEADKLVGIDQNQGWRMFRTLRTLISGRSVQVVLSGERALRTALRDPNSPLFNCTNELLLKRLPIEVVEEIVCQPLKALEIGIADAPTVVQTIYGFTSGHPSIVQRLCRRLMEHLNQQKTRLLEAYDVQTVIEDPAFQRDDFLATYWEAATPLERIISLLMAECSEVRSLASVREALRARCGLQPKLREIDEALQRLVDLRSILSRTSSGYTFAVEAFPPVVAGTVTANDMLEILTEEYAEAGL